MFIALGILVAAAAVVAYAVLLERRWYRLRTYRLDILPAGGPERLDVLHLSDLHMRRGDRGKQRFFATLPAADITVLTGDMVGEPDAVEEVVGALRGSRGRLASLFVLGSNDLWAPRPFNYLRYFAPGKRHHRRPHIKGRAADLVRLLEADGWAHLKNRRGDLDGLDVVGLDDPHIHRGDLRVARRNGDERRLGLAVVHSPDPSAELVALGWDLVVAGHTHGGQVCLPGGRALVTNCSIPPRMAKGLFRLGHGFLHVSPGLGTSKYAPFRLFCRPEATLLELRQPTADTKTAS